MAPFLLLLVVLGVGAQPTSSPSTSDPFDPYGCIFSHVPAYAYEGVATDADAVYVIKCEPPSMNVFKVVEFEGIGRVILAKAPAPKLDDHVSSQDNSDCVSQEQVHVIVYLTFLVTASVMSIIYSTVQRSRWEREWRARELGEGAETAAATTDETSTDDAVAPDEWIPLPPTSPPVSPPAYSVRPESPHFRDYTDPRY